MALHDYRRMIDVYGGGYVAIEVTTENKIRVEWVAIDIDAPTAGLILNALAGAIKTIEGLA